VAVALRERDLLGELALQPAAVEQAGERVVVGEVLELIERAFSIRDVLDLGDEVLRRALVPGTNERLTLTQTRWPSAWMNRC